MIAVLLSICNCPFIMLHSNTILLSVVLQLGLLSFCTLTVLIVQTINKEKELKCMANVAA